MIVLVAQNAFHISRITKRPKDIYVCVPVWTRGLKQVDDCRPIWVDPLHQRQAELLHRRDLRRDLAEDPPHPRAIHEEVAAEAAEPLDLVREVGVVVLLELLAVPRRADRPEELLDGLRREDRPALHGQHLSVQAEVRRLADRKVHLADAERYRWLNDVVCVCPAMSMAVLHANAGHRAYIYQFLRSVPGPGEKTLGSFHGLELPYVFGSFRQPEWSWLPFEPADFVMGESIQNYWANFAKTGNPNEANLPGWTPFDASTFPGWRRIFPKHESSSTWSASRPTNIRR